MFVVSHTRRLRSDKEVKRERKKANFGDISRLIMRRSFALS
jgi:hypothetical protein